MGFDTGHILLNSGDRRLLAKAHEVEYDDSYSDEVWLQYCMAAVTHDFQTFQPSKTPLIQDSSFLARTASNMAARGMSPEKLEPYLQMYNNFPDFKKVIKVHCSDADRKKRLEYRKNHGEKVDYVDEQVGTPWYKKKEEALDEILEWRYGKDKIIDFDNSGMTPQEATAELKKIIEHGR